MPPSDDTSLAEAARQDPQAFAALYDRYLARIYAYALRRTGEAHLAEDVTSATFEKALRHLRRKGWQGHSFLAWLYRIARNEAIHLHRKESRLASLPDRLPASPDQEATLEARQESAQLRRAFALLPTRDQEVLSLRFFEQLSSPEVAQVLGCSLPSLYSQVHRALLRLRVELEQIDGG